MAILKVSLMGHPVLRQPAEEIAPKGLKSDELKALADDMVETMIEYAGVGLAAPQVHYGIRLFVIQPDPSDEDTLLVAANPVVTPLTEETTEAWEGCLSVPDIHGTVPRYLRVRLDAHDRDGKKYSVELEDFAARVAQHEADHMDGILFIDRMPDLSTLSFGQEFRRYLASRPEPEEGDEKEGEAEE
jgi:peptide deformylase